MGNKLEGFYLAGGTALALFYLGHRESYDLDFFTKDFSKIKCEKIISEIKKITGCGIKLVSEQLTKDKGRMLVYYIRIDKNNSLKIDFIEDVYRDINSNNIFNGMPVMSKENIYLRKIYAACGVLSQEMSSGKKIFLGGRQEAKDLFDLYFLSYTFMPLSKFVSKNCTPTEKESVIIWYRSFKKQEMKIGISEIITNKKNSFQEMDKHFLKEINTMIAEEIF
ncbi:MAG: nucleotidyl transferase AbiEii/AbiGii toxin family protein [Candidatus Omnitrophota bacterium]